jgi:hypothetical protein
MAEKKAQGRTLTQMAEEFRKLKRPYTLSRVQFHHDWQQIKKIYQEQTRNSVEEWHNESLAAIQAQEVALWREWDLTHEPRLQEILIKLRDQKLVLLGIAEKSTGVSMDVGVTFHEVLKATGTAPVDLQRVMEVAIRLQKKENEPIQSNEG